MTDYHNYETPAQGTTDWHVPLNENFEAIDRDVAVWDDDGNRGDYAPKDGAHFIAEDTGTVYEGDGSSWIAIGSISGAAEGTEAAGYYTVVSAWDDLQGAIDAANAAGGGTVVLEAGNYGPLGNDDVVEMKSNVTLMGEGPGKTHVVYEGGDDSIVSDLGEPQTDMTVKDMSFDGKGVADSAIHLGYGNPDDGRDRRTTIRNVRAVKFANGGIGVQHTEDARMSDCVIEETGKVSINAAVDCVGAIITDCQILNAKSWPATGDDFRHGVSVEQSKDCVVANCVARGGSLSPAYNFNTHSNGTLVGSVAEDVDWGFLSVRDAWANTVTGCAFRNTDGLAMRVQTYTDDPSPGEHREVLDLVAVGNTFRDIGGPAFHGRYGVSVHFANNTVTNYGLQDSAHAKNAIVVDNDPIIRAEGKIEGNVFRGGEDGVDCISVEAPESTSSFSITNNDCDGNVVCAVPGTWAQGNDVDGSIDLSGGGTAATNNRVAGDVSAAEVLNNL